MSNVIHYNDWKWNDVIVSLVYSFYNLIKNMISSKLTMSIKNSGFCTWSYDWEFIHIVHETWNYWFVISINNIQPEIIQLPSNRFKMYPPRDIWYDHHIIEEYISHKLICNGNEFDNQPILLKYVYGFNNNASSLSINRIAKKVCRHLCQHFISFHSHLKWPLLIILVS